MIDKMLDKAIYYREKNKGCREIESGQGRSLGGGKRGNLTDMWGNNVSGRGNSQCKDPEVRG